MDRALDKIQAINGVYFNMIDTPEQTEIGLIAEEVGGVIPEVVVYEKNGEDAKSVDYARLVSVLIEAIKEQQKDIDQQNSTLAKVKAKIVQFEFALQKLDALSVVRESNDEAAAVEKLALGDEK